MSSPCRRGRSRRSSAAIPGNGITLQSGTSFTQILNDIIGFDINGAPLPNTGQPIVVNASTNNTIVGLAEP